VGQSKVKETRIFFTPLWVPCDSQISPIYGLPVTATLPCHTAIFLCSSEFSASFLRNVQFFKIMF